jgi:alpha-mannosidase
VETHAVAQNPEPAVNRFIACMLVLFALASWTGAAENLALRGVKPTPLFPKSADGARLERQVDLSLENTGPAPVAAAVRITWEGSSPARQEIGEVAPGKSVKSVRVPDRATPVRATFELIDPNDGRVRGAQTLTLQPPRKWTIYHVTYSHEDLGYAACPHILRDKINNENLRRAVQLCGETAEWPAADRYRYQQENGMAVLSFLDTATAQQQEQFAQYVREGRIEVSAFTTTALTTRLNPEVMARLFYLPGRHGPDMTGGPTPRLAMENDVTGLSWGLPVAFQAAGIPYLFHGHNSCGRCDGLESAPLVRWRGPGDTGEVLVHSVAYGSDKLSLKDMATSVAGLIADGEKTTSGNVLLSQNGFDFSLTDRAYDDAIHEWNRRYDYPKLVCATLGMYFEALAKAQPDASRPAVSKHGPDQWLDQDGADAWLTGLTRQTGETLPVAETFATVASTTTPGGYPWFEIETGWNRLLQHLEHTSGAASWAAGDAVHYETEQAEHRGEGTEAAQAAGKALDEALGRLATAIPAPGARTVVVFNPLAHVRTDIVRLRITQLAGQAVRVTDTLNGTAIPCQWLDNETLLFVATNVPATGYRTYRLEDGPADGVTAAPATPVDTAFYRATFDTMTGTMTGLFDKELDVELVDKTAAHRFNEYLYLRYEEPGLKSPPTWYRMSTNATIRAERGPVATVVRVAAKAAGTASLEQRVVFYHALKRVDFALAMEKNPSGRMLSDYRSNHRRGKEAAFIALPFKVPEFKAVFQVPGAGVAEPVRDQFGGTTTAHYGIQHFTDLSNLKFGVTVSPIDFCMVEYGHPRVDELSRAPGRNLSQYEQTAPYPDRSALYLYLLNNMFATNVRIDQRGRLSFAWALRSHAGDWRAGGADQFGRGVNQPLLARLETQPHAGTLPAHAGSFLEVEQPNVALSTCKRAEINGAGYVVRLVETQGRATTTSVRLPFAGPLTRAEEVSLLEVNTGQHLAVTGDTFHVTLPPFGIKTVRVHAGPALPPPAVSHVTTRALSNLEIQLAWQVAPADAGRVSNYRVFRDTKPGFTPTLLNLAHQPATAGCVDKPEIRSGGWLANRLLPGTTYYYRIAAVDRWNRSGPLSDEVSVTTSRSAATSPAPAAPSDLRAILISPVSPANQVNLLWRVGAEADVVSYDIYRSPNAAFSPGEATRLAELKVEETTRRYDHQMFLDTTAAPGTTNYYFVRARNAAGKPGSFSAIAAVATKPPDSVKLTAPNKPEKPPTGEDATPPFAERNAP